MSESPEDDTVLVEAMRAFEKFAPDRLRYPEAKKWHTCDLMAMRAALRAAFPALHRERDEARKALEPFADIPVGDAADEQCLFNHALMPTVGDVRRARDIIDPLPPHLKRVPAALSPSELEEQR